MRGVDAYFTTFEAASTVRRGVQLTLGLGFGLGLAMTVGCGADKGGSGSGGATGTGGDCDRGTLDCRCTKKSACDEGLECVEDVCIDPNAPMDTGTETGGETSSGQPGPCMAELDVVSGDISFPRKWIDFETGEIMDLPGTPDASTGMDFSLLLDPMNPTAPPPNGLGQVTPGTRIGNMAAFDMVAAADCDSATNNSKGDAITILAEATTVYVVETTDGHVFTVGEFAYPMSMDPSAPQPVELWWNDPCTPNFLCP